MNAARAQAAPFIVQNLTPTNVQNDRSDLGVRSMNPSDDHMQQRQAEKDEALADIAVVLDAIEHEHRNPDQWERVHLARAFAAMFSGGYSSAMCEARIALALPSERSQNAKLPHTTFLERCDLSLLMRVWHEAKAESVKPFPHFGRVVLK
jgi:hypothetical protein